MSLTRFAITVVETLLIWASIFVAKSEHEFIAWLIGFAAVLLAFAEGKLDWG